MDCLFCKMIEGKIPHTKIYENENVLGFVDIYPQAKKHYLFISKRHTQNINDMSKSDPQAFLEVFQAIQEFTQAEKLDETGFRVVTNLGRHGGQTVFHTHFHVLAGEQLGTFGK